MDDTGSRWASRRSSSVSVGSSRSPRRRFASIPPVMDYSAYVSLVSSSAEFRRNIAKFENRVEALTRREIACRANLGFTEIVLGAIPKRLLKKPKRPQNMCGTTLDEDALIRSRLAEGGVLSTRNNVEIRKDTLACLCPKTWLNDEVLNFYFDLLNEHSEGKVYCWNTFFWLKVSGNGTGYSYKAVSRWAAKRNLNIFELDLMLVPMNIGGNHWALGVVDFVQYEIRYYDSLAAKTVHASFLDCMQQYLNDEWRRVNVNDSPPEFGPALANPPQQTNSYDCGVFTCMNAECLASGREWIDFDQSMIPQLRKKMTLQILQNSLNP